MLNTKDALALFNLLVGENRLVGAAMLALPRDDDDETEEEAASAAALLAREFVPRLTR